MEVPENSSGESVAPDIADEHPAFAARQLYSFSRAKAVAHDVKIVAKAGNAVARLLALVVRILTDASHHEHPSVWAQVLADGPQQRPPNALVCNVHL